ncbi:MAG: hypothetical protein JW880_04335 [Candidatus Thermoplasmatota archaeon]|nr:hypothetical protein [Candidatus Thermoplasmatota archaeon]
MEGRTRTRPKGASALFFGWPERTNRVLIVVVVLALLLGVPVLSMAIPSVHLDRQIVVIEPGSYLAFHFGFYGYGEIEYMYNGISGSDLRMLELDSVNYHLFVAGKSYQSISSHRIYSSGVGGHGEGGFIWDKYLVLVNDGADTGQLELEMDGRVYLSMLPAGVISLTASAVGYLLGRQADKEARLDIANPVIMARRGLRRKALATIALLSLLPMGILLAIAYVTPATPPFFLRGGTFGFYIGLFVTLLIVFQLRFKLTKDQVAQRPLLANLAYRLRVSGYRVTEGEDRLIVHISSTSAVHTITRKASDGTWVLYKTSATPKGFGILIVLSLTFLGAPLALGLSLFMLYRTSVFASTRVLPRLSQLPIPQPQGGEADTRMMIVESLSEGRRLSAEAYECARSNYHDAVILMAIVGIVLGNIVGILAYQQTDFDARIRIALAVAILFSVLFAAVSWLFLGAKFRPRINEFKAWTTKLDAALSREAAGLSPSDGEPSSFELIADSFKEMPKWLKARRRAGGYRRPLYWLLMFFLLYGAFILGMNGYSYWAEETNPTAGIAAMALAVALALLAAFSYWVVKRRLNQEMETTLSEWNERQEALRLAMERLLAGE